MIPPAERSAGGILYSLWFYIRTTVHKDVTDRLKKINPAIYAEVKSVLDHNKSERHIRGGIATREKYARIKGLV